MSDSFLKRHIGPSLEEQKEMLKVLGYDSLDDFIQDVLPNVVKNYSTPELDLPSPMNEKELLDYLKEISEKNPRIRSFIGMGYYPSFLPPILKRQILENPAWYTPYTPYQAEISQGRLEALMLFQTMVVDLTGMEIANASLLDEASAAGEALVFCSRVNPKRTKVLVSKHLHPQTIHVLQTRAKNLDFEIEVISHEKALLDENVLALFLQYPTTEGTIEDYRSLVEAAHEHQILVAVATDLLALTLLMPPGEWGADVVFGSAQRFGLPLGYGGPHAAFFATRKRWIRYVPGRIVGISKDRFGNPAYRLTLQTREQHIKRERATSNICTAQVLLAVLNAMYAVYHGPEGLKSIAEEIHKKTFYLKKYLTDLSLYIEPNYFFDTIKVYFSDNEGSYFTKFKKLADELNYIFRYWEDEFAIGISLDEITTLFELYQIYSLFAKTLNKVPLSYAQFEEEYREFVGGYAIPSQLYRSSPYLTHPTFHKYQTETKLMRYIRTLEEKDLSLVHSMISLGSCTMKLNSATELTPISWDRFSDYHPYIPLERLPGWEIVINELGKFLCEITGYSSITFQPNSGAQGELTGLLIVRAYHCDRGEEQRKIVFIPSSAHGTNPASASLAGCQVVVIKCDQDGNIDIEDLKVKLEQYSSQLAALMVTYPSTHGVFEENIKEVIDLVHQAGGQVYLDGANMNAMVGLIKPADLGADLCHLNLHKTFAIPHGGGGPGMGPVLVASHLVPYLPQHPLHVSSDSLAIGPITSSPYGSALILLISYAYIRLLGSEGLGQASKIAILNANYIKKRLKEHYKILYEGRKGWNAHEFILDLRPLQVKSGVTAEDVAKRLMDYGFHAPTVSFPVPGTLMIEPTESEDKEELDRFCDALIQIREEIDRIINNIYPKDDNPLKNAPHPAFELAQENWEHPYSRELAAYPLSYLKARKFWVPVGRIDNAYGDRNPICVCPPVEYYSNMIS